LKNSEYLLVGRKGDDLTGEVDEAGEVEEVEYEAEGSDGVEKAGGAAHFLFEDENMTKDAAGHEKLLLDLLSVDDDEEDEINTSMMRGAEFSKSDFQPSYKPDELTKYEESSIHLSRPAPTLFTLPPDPAGQSRRLSAAPPCERVSQIPDCKPLSTMDPSHHSTIYKHMGRTKS
jgi:hypothetical protein